MKKNLLKKLQKKKLLKFLGFFKKLKEKILILKFNFYITSLIKKQREKKEKTSEEKRKKKALKVLEKNSRKELKKQYLWKNFIQFLLKKIKILFIKIKGKIREKKGEGNIMLIDSAFVNMLKEKTKDKDYTDKWIKVNFRENKRGEKNDK